MGDQEAGGSCSFAVALVARLSSALESGPWTYRRLHWQAGEVGHRLYLAAEASGLGATGLSGFYDQHARTILGLQTEALEPLYWLAVGPRAETEAALEAPYPHRGEVEPMPPSRGGWQRRS